MGDEYFNILLIKQLVTNITTQNFGFVYNTVYGDSHHGVTSFAVPSLYPTIIAQLDIAQQAEDGTTMVKVADKNNASKGPPPLPE